MTPKEYFEQHIPHRINLLITFRERYNSHSTLKPNDIRDFFRCSKDISMLMVRFLLGELGINFRKAKDNPNDDISEYWRPKFGIKQLTEQEVKADIRYTNIKVVLKAANRAIAHIEPTDVYHAIKLDTDHQILFDAINFTQEKLIENMYLATNSNYDEIMSRPENDMERKPI